MNYLSLELLNENLKKTKNAMTENGIPQGFDETFYKTFLRVLSSPVKELDDIPSEMIVEMLEKGERLFDTLCIDDGTFFNIFSRLNASRSTVVAKKRRIL